MTDADYLAIDVAMVSGEVTDATRQAWRRIRGRISTPAAPLTLADIERERAGRADEPTRETKP